MNKQPNYIKQHLEQKQKQDNTDILAVALCSLMGANVVRKADFDKVNQEKQELLRKTKDIEEISMRLWASECKLQAFIRYHSKWKPTTRNFEKRLQKLIDGKVYVEFTEYPKDISENLKEAYKCYINGLPMACYIIILRTIEITVNLIYEQHNKPQVDKDGRNVFINASVKLNWVKGQKMIGGADFQVAKAFIAARNDSVHELYVPTEKQILSAFETVINLVKNLKTNII